MGDPYERLGVGYAVLRRADPRIAAHLHRALGAGSVVDVGAGAGSYEPASTVLAVEPSATMIAQRPAGAARAVRAVAEALPLADGCVDATLAVLTTHHWTDVDAGLAELVRVSARQVVLTWDQACVAREFWLVADYLPEIAAREAELACLDAVTSGLAALGRHVDVTPVPLPADCTDAVLAAHWSRPHAYVDPAVRAAASGFALLPPGVVDAAVARLAADLADGTWRRRYGHLLDQPERDLGYRMVVAT